MAWVVFVAAGRMLTPSTSGAAEVGGGGPPGISASPVPRSLGSLVGNDYHVRMNAGPGGPRFDVVNSAGMVIRASMDADQLAVEFPELDVRKKDASAKDMPMPSEH